MLDCLLTLIRSAIPAQVIESVYALGNIAQVGQALAQSIVEHQIFDELVRLIKSSDLQVRMEAVFCLHNILTNLDSNSLLSLVRDTMTHPELLKDYFKSLRLTSRKNIVLKIFDTVENLCKVDIELQLEGEESLKYLMETTTDLYDSLEELSQHGDVIITEKAEELIDTYLKEEDDA